MEIPPGTQPGDVLVLAKKGVPKLNRPSIRGDHLFTVEVSIPKRISVKERQLLEELSTLSTTTTGSSRKHTRARPQPPAATNTDDSRPIGESAKTTEKSEDGGGDFMKKLSDFAGSLANGAAKWWKDNFES